MKTHSARLRCVNGLPISSDGKYVLYWMIAARRLRFNFALEYAADLARDLGRPLVVLEALRSDYRWASDRFHQFVIDGMRDNARNLAERTVLYYPYIEPTAGAGRGLLAALADQAAVVVTDDYPAFFLRRMVTSAGSKIGTRLEAVDGNGLLPMASADREFKTAYSFRRFLQKILPIHLDEMPLQDPLADALPQPESLDSKILGRWPKQCFANRGVALADLTIDHNVAPTGLIGGASAAESALAAFLDDRLAGYKDLRNRPSENGTSGLSPYLHFGHLSAHQIFIELMLRLRWTPEDIALPANGRRSGWWGVGESAEAFLDQFITWRELGFNLCYHRDDHDRFSALPEWARLSLGDHAHDRRDYVYSQDEFTNASTHDPLWNAAQRQLVNDGYIHNYLRMLWGKKILEWSETPQQALETMFELNNRFALDGRDPNSSTGILWTLGRFDRPWGPERPVFGKIRYMSSANTARKFPVSEYLNSYGEVKKART